LRDDKYDEIAKKGNSSNCSGGLSSESIGE